jgi:hypothetical protein
VRFVPVSVIVVPPAIGPTAGLDPVSYGGRNTLRATRKPYSLVTAAGPSAPR